MADNIELYWEITSDGELRIHAESAGRLSDVLTLTKKDFMDAFYEDLEASPDGEMGVEWLAFGIELSDLSNHLVSELLQPCD